MRCCSVTGTGLSVLGAHAAQTAKMNVGLRIRDDINVGSGVPDLVRGQ